MRARLEYIAGSERVLLEEMELCELDQYTCKNFNKLEDIKSNSKYKGLLAGVSENGSFRIFFNTDEIGLFWQSLLKSSLAGASDSSA